MQPCRPIAMVRIEPLQHQPCLHREAHPLTRSYPLQISRRSKIAGYETAPYQLTSYRGFVAREVMCLAQPSCRPVLQVTDIFKIHFRFGRLKPTSQIVLPAFPGRPHELEPAEGDHSIDRNGISAARSEQLPGSAYSLDCLGAKRKVHPIQDELNGRSQRMGRPKEWQKSSDQKD